MVVYHNNQSFNYMIQPVDSILHAPYLPEHVKKFIDKLNVIIEKNYASCEFNVRKLVNLIALSERQLQRKIKHIFNLTPAEFIRHYRLYKAKPLLIDGKPIAHVADLVGFTSANYFTRCFKQLFDVTPTEFIAQLFDN